MTANATIVVIVCVQCALIAWIVYRFTPPEYFITYDDGGDDPPEPQPDPDEEWKRNLDR